jgi:ribosomal protein S12 methylthiotransferase
MRAIVSEARAAADAGAREIILVGQDTTRFGKDRNGSGNLATVLHNLSRIDGIEWLRILYTYPTHFSNHLIETIRDLPKVVHYLDIPLQHSHDDILARMNRRGTNADITRLINRLRETIHGITIRTTFMVGFPGETEKHFEHLLDFMERMCFDHVGIFAYSAEQGTKAALFPEQVPEPVKQERRDAAMRLQNAISLASNKRLVGRRFRVLIDSASSERKRFALGRTYRDAPEIDGRTFVQGNDLLPGTMVDVEITGAEAYDLIGKRV